MKKNRNLKRFSKNKRRITGVKKKRSRNRKTKNRNRKTLNMKGGMFGRVGFMNPDRLAFSMKLSIKMHEFAMYCHFKMTGNPNFIFYVQPMAHMAKILRANYGELAEDVEYTEGNGGDNENIRTICGGNLQTGYNMGMKIPFIKIYEKYSHVVPEIYMSTKVNRSFINRYGFQLLYKQDYFKEIHDFYNTVREYFCKIDFDYINNYIRNLKKAYEDKLGDKTWKDYGSMELYTGFEIGDTLDFLVEFINKEDDEDEIIKLAKYYVDLFSEQMGDVRTCQYFDQDMEMVDLDGTYMIIKLKNPEGGFVYDNTEMVVHRCYFDETTPAQYHIGIMRNPSDMIQSKFKKLIKSDKLEIINRSNSEARFF